jgi:hypothetical protein
MSMQVKSRDGAVVVRRPDGDGREVEVIFSEMEVTQLIEALPRLLVEVRQYTREMKVKRINELESQARLLRDSLH